jgi:large subunit ribosomal protein L24
MKKAFSTKWVSSKKPRKQRKFRLNAPLHKRGAFITAHLSKELHTKHGIKKLHVRSGDKVKIMRGKFKGKEGKVDLIDIKKSKVYIVGIELTKKDGSKAKIPTHASNVMIVDLNLDDKTRIPQKTQQNQKTQKISQTQKTQDKTAQNK